MNAEELKKFMEEEGLTAAQVAEEMSRTKRHVYYLLNNKYNNPNWREVENMILAYKSK